MDRHTDCCECIDCTTFKDVEAVKLHIEVLQDENKELRRLINKGNALLVEGVNKYKVLMAHCEEQDILIRAMKTGDESELRATRGTVN